MVSDLSIGLWTSWYTEPDPIRRRELRECLERNLDNGALDHIHLFCERCDAPLTHPKLIATTVTMRPTYGDFLSDIRAWCDSNDGTTFGIIANSDIFFDQTILTLADRQTSDQVAALARWDVAHDGTPRLFNRNDSQDVWTFKGRPRDVAADFCVGIPRCDNRMLHELRNAGYEVINPAYSIRTYHLHAGQREEYPAMIDGPSVDGPYEYLWPHNLCGLLETCLYRVNNRHAPLKWYLDRRLLVNCLPLRLIRAAFRKGVKLLMGSGA